jgi:dipeptidyl aminopeptidase/acylaminoacyl peptidase
LTVPDRNAGEISHAWPQLLPNGKGLIFDILTTADGWQMGALSLESGEWSHLFPASGGAVYLPTGHLLYAQSGGLLTVPFDQDQLQVRGSSTPVLDGLAHEHVAGGRVSYFAVSSIGSLAYLAGGRLNEYTLSLVDRRGRSNPLREGVGYDPRFSSDGRWLAAGQEGQVWIHDLERGTRTRLTEVAVNYVPVWTPDDSRVAFASYQSGMADLCWMRVDGSEGPELLLEREYRQYPQSWSPDGRILAFRETHPETGADIWVLSLDGDRAPQLVLGTRFNEDSPRFSPDGRWLAYTSDASGRDEVYAQPFPGPGREWRLSTDGGRAPVWSFDGRELFYRNGKQIMAVAVETDPTFGHQPPRLLFEYPNLVEDAWALTFDVSPDGENFVLVGDERVKRTELHIVLNWVEELKQLVPESN